jgi:hypothetical protein
MEIPKSELFSVLQEFNPWWSGQPQTDLPVWERAAARQVWRWVKDETTRRALLLIGARQVGKTTILRQTIRRLAQSGVQPHSILYATFDHPILRLCGLERALAAWEELYPAVKSQPRFHFLDEVQFVADWQTWIKHQVDFRSGNRIAATGSAVPLRDGISESGVGRWTTVPLPTLTFREYLTLREVTLPKLVEVKSLRELFEWETGDFQSTLASARMLTAHFHEYLLRGGFPEPAQLDDIAKCQRQLREDIVDKVLKRDMTAFFGVRRILDLERIFLYLCYHDGGILDVSALTKSLEGVNRQSAINYLDLFEAAHLIYRLKSFGYGKNVLRGKDKVYLADAALPGAILLQGRKLLEKAERLGAAVETAFFKHLFTRFYSETPRFSYWRDSKKGFEVDLIVELPDRIVPFEVKYRDESLRGDKLKGLRLFLEQHQLRHGYVITQSWEDFGIHIVTSARPGHEYDRLDAKVAAIPAPLACYWLS